MSGSQVLSSSRNSDKVIRSPCVSICALDVNDVCVGCYRTGQEIASWGEMSNDQRLEVLRRVALREAESGRTL